MDTIRLLATWLRDVLHEHDLAALLRMDAQLSRRRVYWEHHPTEALESFRGHWARAASHKLTGPWAAARGDVRLQRGLELLGKYRSGKPEKGSWLKAKIYAAIKYELGPEAKSPTIPEILAILPDVVDSFLEKKFG